MYNSQLLTKCVLFPVVLFPSGVLCSRYQDVKPVLPLNISGIGVSEADVRSAASPKQKILSATSSAVLTLPSLPYVADSNAIIVSRDLQDEARDVFIQSVSTSSSVQPTAPDAKHTRNVRPGIVFPSVVDLNIVGKDAATEPSSSGIWHKSFPVDGDSRNARQYRDPYLLNINSTNPSRMVSEKKAAPISSVSVPPSSFTALFVQLLHESRFPFRFEGPSVSSAVAREGAGIDGVEVPSGEATFDGVAGDKGDAVEILDRGVLAAEPGWSSTKLVIISALVSFLIFISLPLIVAFAYEYFIMKAKTFYHIDYSRSLDLLDDEGDFAISKWDCFEDLETLCYTLWLLPLRAMDSHIASGVMLLSSWYAVLVVWMIPILFPLWLARKRQAMRSLLGSKNTKQFVVADICFVCFCTSCAVIQEARTIDIAVGAKTSCCFTVTYPRRSAVGMPLYVTFGTDG